MKTNGTRKYRTIRRNFPSVSRYEKHGREYFLVDARSKRWGLSIRKNFNNSKDALGYARELETQISKNGKSVTEQARYQSSHVDKMIERLRERGKTLDDCVNFYFLHLEQETRRQIVPRIGDLCDTWYQNKRDCNLRPLKKKTLNELKSYHKFIKDHWGRLKPFEVNRKLLEGVYAKLPNSNITRRQKNRYVRQFFNWCKEEGYCSGNPTDGIKITVTRSEVTILTPRQVIELLRLVETKFPEMVGFYVLCVFAGLRPSESQRVRWEDINFEGKEIYVKPEGKTGARRFILENKKTQDTDALWVWLNHFKSIRGDQPFNPTQNHEGTQKKIRSSAGFQWSQDVLRHSFGTYYYNLIHDLGKVVHDMGNSEAICKRHYLREVANSATKEFWAIRPMKNEEKTVESTVISPSFDGKMSEKIATPHGEISVTR
jgi:integrase